MAYDLEEQESLAEIKAWWDKWGTLILSLVTACCLAAAAYQGWRWYQMKQSADAGTLYAQMIQAEKLNDYKRVQAIAQRLQDDYASTSYAGMGVMLAAKISEADKKNQEAEKLLVWLSNSDKHPELKGIASVRLAGILMDEEKYDQALKVLDNASTDKENLYLIEDRRGDVYRAMGERDKARRSWEKALRNMNATNPAVNLIEVKMNSLPKDQGK